MYYIGVDLGGTNIAIGITDEAGKLLHKASVPTGADRGPDFVKLAEAYGLGGKRVSTVSELEDAIKEALACGHGYVIDCTIEMDEMVRPMVPAGGKITQFLVD